MRADVHSAVRVKKKETPGLMENSVQLQVTRKFLIFPNKQETHCEQIMKDESESSVNEQQQKQKLTIKCSNAV